LTHDDPVPPDIQDRLTRLSQDRMPSGRSATSDVPDRRGEVGDEAVVTSEGLSSRLASVVVGIGRDGCIR
jgi:hypothetical protein